MSATWQTWAVIAFSVAAGRFLAGNTFGYTLFAVVWGPIAGTWIVDGRRAGRAVGQLAGVVLLFSLPWLTGWPTEIAMRLLGWQTALTFATVGGSTLIGRPAVMVGWLSWVAIPPLMAGSIGGIANGRLLDGLLSIHPIVLTNLTDTTAGDWTHQSIAYSTLTRLGQDVPFAWPDAQIAAVVPYLLIGGMAVWKMFHVEHFPAPSRAVLSE